MTATVSWRALLIVARSRVGDIDARRIVEAASGFDGGDLVLHLDDPVSRLGHARFSAMVDRRARGEPLQYVVGQWGFRTLDLLVDHRVLIPRPETEIVVEHALAVAAALDARVAVDLGTGSGAIALALASERSNLDVWATDISTKALEVARANLAGAGRPAARVRVEHGDWFDALPESLTGSIDLVVANPPYVAADDHLPSEVRDWEPIGALVSGPTGLEAIEHILGAAPPWLRRPGAVVLEIGETQADAVAVIARAAGFATTRVAPDLTGRPRVLVATV